MEKSICDLDWLSKKSCKHLLVMFRVYCVWSLNVTPHFNLIKSRNENMHLEEENFTEMFSIIVEMYISVVERKSY